jgi:hypothetical protein
MSQRSHECAPELHNLAAHTHSAAAAAHGKGDHLSAHELSRLAQEHSLRAFNYESEWNNEGLATHDEDKGHPSSRDK